MNELPLEPTLWLTQTKLVPPRLRDDYIPRARLLSLLARFITSYPLTLISAPAGYGKTTLLASFSAVSTQPSLTWLSLDEEDNDPTHFISALTTALQNLNPACGVVTQTLLSSLANPITELRRLVSVLINEVLQTLPEPFILVLDDLHLITEPAIFVCLDYLLERAPPPIRLIVATRYDPPLALARLRARGQLAELRLDNLRFSTEEACLFLNEKLGFNLAPAELATLQNRAEGWPAGLRLLAASLERISAQADRTTFIQNLAQTDCYVFDFLAQEVLARQQPDHRTFLLETAILTHLEPELCRAVTGRSDAQAILEELYRHNLFLVRVAEIGPIFRYHPLFAEFLRRQLSREMPERLADLHGRAAAACLSTSPAKAIGHYLAGKLWAEAALAIEQWGDQWLRQGLQQTLQGWIETLPASVRQGRPRLTFFLGACAVQQGNLEEATILLEQARIDFTAIGDRAGCGEALLELVGVASQQHAYEREATLVQQALAFPLSAHGRVQLLMARVWQSLYKGNPAQAETDLTELLELALTSGTARTFQVVAPILNMPLALLPRAATRLEQYCRQVLLRFGEGVGPVQAGAHSLLGYLNFLRGRLDEAQQAAENARSISQQLGGFGHLDVQNHYVLGISPMCRGNAAASGRYWESLLPWVEQTSSIRFLLGAFLYLLGRAYWLQGQGDQAQQTYRQILAIRNSEDLPEVKVSRTLLQALLEISNRRYPQAEEALRQAMTIEKKWPHSSIFGHPRLMLAYLYFEWGRPEAALAEFLPLLAETERREMPGLLLQEGRIMTPLLRLATRQGHQPSFSAALLDVLEPERVSRPVQLPDTGETLTPREAEVLCLLATGASNRDIAAQLVITERTVKAHITNILAKLHVSSRTQAIARARDMGLV